MPASDRPYGIKLASLTSQHKNSWLVSASCTDFVIATCTMANSQAVQIILLYCILQVKCDIIYIRESEQSFCPHLGSCLTLTQFTDDSELHIQTNTTVILMPGSHHLNQVLSVTNVSLFEMVAIDNATDQNENVRIVCNSMAYFEFTLCDIVHVKHITFINCGGNRASNVGTFSLYNSTLIGQRTIKSALTFNRTREVIINDSYFVSNRGSSLQEFFIPEDAIYSFSLFLWSHLHTILQCFDH